jgi:hypothetical protein
MLGDMKSNTAYGQEIFERLLHAVTDRASGGAFDVARGDAEFKVSTPAASLTTYLLPNEPSFLVNFDLGDP